ncbi:MAG: hypothetical protein AB1831_01680 [Pseudomonadota bacterium]
MNKLLSSLIFATTAGCAMQGFAADAPANDATKAESAAHPAAKTRHAAGATKHHKVAKHKKTHKEAVGNKSEAAPAK